VGLVTVEGAEKAASVAATADEADADAAYEAKPMLRGRPAEPMRVMASTAAPASVPTVGRGAEPRGLAEALLTRRVVASFRGDAICVAERKVPVDDV